jgi:hypothetical protein
VRQEYYKNWKKEGCLYTEADGKTYFYYPYSAGGENKREDGLLLGGADDVGHFSISMQGVMLVHDATPELGPDDDFMTAVANAVYHNSTTKNGSIQCPSADKIKPLSRHPSQSQSERAVSICSKPSGRALLRAKILWLKASQKAE